MLPALALSILAAAMFYVSGTALASEFALGVGLGLLVFGLICRGLRVEGLRDYRYLALITAFVLASLLVAFGTGPAGTDARINLFGVQPVEPIKLLVLVFLASYFAANDVELRRLDGGRVLGMAVPRGRDALPVAIALAAALSFFFLQRDLGPALVLYLVFLGLFVAASGRVLLGALGFGALLAAFWTTWRLNLLPTVTTRIEMWLSPWDNHRPGGGQLAESLWALASGGVAGSTADAGSARMIPAGHTDLILAATGETFGAWAVAGALAASLLLVLLAARQAWRVAGAFERYLAFGIALLFGVQTLLIAGGTVGLLPLTGIPYPFMSYGKSAIITHFVALGLLAAIGRQPTATRPRVPLSRWALVPLGLAIAGIGLVGWQIWQVMVIQADDVLVRGAVVRQADGVRRYTYNRRVSRLLAGIPRGRILDRHGVVLAEDDDAGRRRYPLGAAAPHVVGHASRAWADPQTVERAQADRLRGLTVAERVVLVDGVRTVARDYRALVPAFRERHEPEGALALLAGRERDVTIALDARVQQATMQALEGQLAATGNAEGGRAAAVVLDVRSGAILASVSLPSYDPNVPDDQTLARMFDDPFHAAFDRARDGRYPPGSSFKLVTALAILAAGVDPGRAVMCEHRHAVSWSYERRRYRRSVTDDERVAPHGAVTLGRAVAESCNVYFAEAATWAGAPALWHAAHDRLGLEIRDVPTPAMMAEHLADHAYGQARVTVTPMEMAAVAAAIANGGSRVTPTLQPGDVDRTPAGGPAIPAAHAELLQGWMREAVRTGTGRRAAVPGVVVAGKTGTAETAAGASHAWFVGFAHRPGQLAAEGLAFAVLIEHGGYGGQAAAEAARDIVTAALAPVPHE